LNTRTGGIGSWSGSFPAGDEHASLAAFLKDAADSLEGVTSGNTGETSSGRARELTPSAARELTSADEAILLTRANGYRK
jgi:hypothetical protein